MFQFKDCKIQTMNMLSGKKSFIKNNGLLIFTCVFSCAYV